MESSLKLRFSKLATRENLIYLLFISTFFHYIATSLAVVLALVVILCNKSARTQLFTHPGSKFLPIFSIAVSVMAAIRGNWLGVACAIGFFLILLISLWVRTNLRRSVFEKALSYCSIISCILAPFAYIQAEFYPLPDERVALWFFNSNYMAFMCLIAFAIGVYKLLTTKRHIWIYIVSILCNLFSMYYCASIFIWIDVVVVTVVLLLLFKKWPIVLAFFGLVAIACVVIYFNPRIIPRYYAADNAADIRFSIWRAAMDAIKKSPLIGYGFLGFNHINGNYPEAYVAPHTHNILLEILLDFGLVGTALLLPFFIRYFKNLKMCYEYSVSRNTTNLILALIIAMAVHGFIDIVFIWIQTGTLMALIIGGLGMDEKLLDRVQAKPSGPKATE